MAAALHAFLVGRVHGPFVFMDELGYERMAQSFAHTGHFSLFGKGGLAYSPLYPIVLSPIYALTSSLHTAYEWAKVENAVLISLSVFPVYGIARSVFPRGRSLGVAALSLLAPLMLYSGFEMSESLAYPLCLLAIWTMLRAVRRPSVANDALMLARDRRSPRAARLQLVVLLPAALTAVLLVPRSPGRRGRSRDQAVGRGALARSSAIVGVALVAGLARTVMNGGNLPLAGRYANVGTAHASALARGRALLPAPRRARLCGRRDPVRGRPARRVRARALRASRGERSIFASVAVASTFWFLLEVALDAAAFDATSAHPRTASAFTDLPRIHERYLIYLVPLFLVALFAALRLRRPRSRRPVARRRRPSWRRCCRR